MTYRYDTNLEFLARMQLDDFNSLAYYITNDKYRPVRLTEELTTAEIYKRHHPEHHQC